MKKIVRPDFKYICKGDHYMKTPTLYEENFMNWFNEQVEPINQAIDDAIVVYCDNPQLDHHSCNNLWTMNNVSNDTHKALLINIEPLKKDTAEDILRDILTSCYGDDTVTMITTAEWNRAKALLGES